MQIDHQPIDALKAYGRNSRTHSAAQVAQIAASLQEFGWTNPILVDGDGTIIAGHGRVQAARSLGMTEVPTISLARLSEAQRRAYVIADNKLALSAGWDAGILALELSELRDLGMDLDVTGFAADEVLDLMAVERPSKGLTDDDATPEPPAVPTTRPGEVWLLGGHRVMCGDSTRTEQLQVLMGGGEADLLLTDPPYNVDYQGGTKAALKIQNDKKTDIAFRQFLTDAFCSAASVLKPGGAFYIWHADSEGFNFRSACMAAALKVRQCLVWKKSTLVMGRQDYHWKHEPCLYGWKDGAGHKWYGGRKLTTVVDLGDGSPFVQLPDGRWEVAVGDRRFIVSGDATVEEFAPSVLEFDKPQRSADHPTMKPVALFEYQMRNNTRVGDVVLDSFGGSGTTAIACEKHDRYARLMELDPKYVDVIVRRWQEYTGRQATLEAGGATFDQLTEERQV